MPNPGLRIELTVTRGSRLGVRWKDIEVAWSALLVWGFECLQAVRTFLCEHSTCSLRLLPVMEGGGRAGRHRTGAVNPRQKPVSHCQSRPRQPSGHYLRTYPESMIGRMATAADLGAALTQGFLSAHEAHCTASQGPRVSRATAPVRHLDCGDCLLRAEVEYCPLTLAAPPAGTWT